MIKPLKLILVVALALVFTWAVGHFQFARDLEMATIDLRELAFSPKTAVSDRIVMVWLDENTMADLPYRSPVPRDFLTKLNDRLAQASPAAIGYDIYFKDPSFAEADQSLATSLAKTRAYAVMPLRDRDSTFAARAASTTINDFANHEPRTTNYEGLVDPPLPLFAHALKGLGLADLPIGAFDTKVRSARLNYTTGKGEIPTFAALLYNAATGANAFEAVGANWHWPTLGPIRFTPFFLGNNSVLIRYAGPPSAIGSQNNAFKIFPAKLVANGVVPLDWFKDKIVLVGAAYNDFTDAFPTPFFARATGYARMNGVEIHANVLNMLLSGRFYYGLGKWQGEFLIFVLAAFLGFLALFFPTLRGALISIAAIISLIIFSAYAFMRAGIAIPVVMPCMAGVFSYGIGTIARALTEGRQRRLITQTFAKYVPKTVVDIIAKDPSCVRLGGDERIVTSLFSDIASFTSISEKIEPAETMKFLNEYLDHMNRAILGLGGTIDKYEGDAVVAFFNAPLDVEFHETCAAKAALAMQSASKAVSDAWSKRIGRNVVTRVGINTGRALVGNLGSEGRFDYTAIGDAINLASRLEGANKFYGTRIIASESTAAHLFPDIILRPVDRVRVVGRADPVRIYEIVGLTGDPQTAALVEITAKYREAFELFEKRMFHEALARFEKIFTQYPNDSVVERAIERTRRALAEPEWDLISNLEIK